MTKTNLPPRPPLSPLRLFHCSHGGSLVTGLRIGEAIRRKGFSTIVPDGRRCASACAFAWLGGIERSIGTDARLGFHAAYDAAPDREKWHRKCRGRRISDQTWPASRGSHLYHSGGFE